MGVFKKLKSKLAAVNSTEIIILILVTTLLVTSLGFGVKAMMIGDNGIISGIEQRINNAPDTLNNAISGSGESINSELIEAKIEYFTWAEDTRLTQAITNNNVSELYPELQIMDEVEGCNYSYPDATGITGLSSEGLQWLRTNGYNLYLPESASAIINSGTQPFGYMNSVYPKEMNELKSVNIPKSMRYIDKSAFFGVDGITSIDLKNVTSIGGGCFAGMQGLTYFNAPNLTVMPAQTFRFCTSLKEVHLSDNITSLEQIAFVYCYKLETVTGLKNVNSIGTGVFQQCYELKNLDFNTHINSIGQKAFYKTGYKLPSSVVDSTTTYGTNATYLQDWTSGLPEYTKKAAHSFNIKTYSQQDEKWASYKIGGTNDKYTISSAGCGWVVFAEMYNTLYNKNLTPIDLVEKIKSEDASALGSGSYDHSKNNQICEILDLKLEATYGTDSYSQYSPFEIQPIIDAVSAGKMVTWSYKPSSSGHVVLIYGIDSDGYLLVADSSKYNNFTASTLNASANAWDKVVYSDDNCTYRVSPSAISGYDYIQIFDKK